ncbi:MAG TPA: geranylgeranylglyceryl/heptaprenylglyceryl phosphate synthase [Lentimicrobium sp.]|nr:geranylgeranylglyceryl/heptaprenylglyceryl phosphate synthase [Lentimicrobium sp.]
MQILNSITSSASSGKKQLAVLVDPDKADNARLLDLAGLAAKKTIDYFFVGGSLLVNNGLDNCIKILQQESGIPVILFPGNTLQMSYRADAILFLSLISGRNPEMLIGRHVIAAPYLKLSNIEVIGTGYMLIESGRPTAVSYMSNSDPIPADKNDIAMCTAMAGEMLGLKLIYMDAGSGAINPVSSTMIEHVRQSISIPIIVGGGITTPQLASRAVMAGADIIVVGNGAEKDPSIISQISDAIK